MYKPLKQVRNVYEGSEGQDPGWEKGMVMDGSQRPSYSGLCAALGGAVGKKEAQKHDREF